MAETLFTNVRLFDGTGAPSYPADVLIVGERIASIPHVGEARAAIGPGTRVVDGRGQTLMAGMIESHAHLSWRSSVERASGGMSTGL